MLILSLISLFLCTFSPFSVNQSTLLTNIILDVNFYYLSLISILVTFISFSYISQKSISSSLSLLTLLACSILMFSTTNMFLLYLYFEASLLPILFIILKWGSYPDRSVASTIILSFTAVLSIPFIRAISSTFSKTLTLFIPQILSTSSQTLSTIILLSFFVKLPVYGLHFWLPIAHVEAPTFGSILLAGILLKLGGIGLIRLLFLVSYSILFNLLSYGLIFLTFVTLICCFQSDFKRLIAFSSVSHIITIPLLLIAIKPLSLSSALLIIYFHGLSSPILFSLVGVVYSLAGTRLLYLLRGYLLLNPFLALVSTLLLFFTMSTPPMPSFIPEVIFFFSTISISIASFLSLFLFAFVSIVYSLSWYVPINFQSTSQSANSYFLSFNYTISFMLGLLLTFLSLFILWSV